MSKQGMPQVRTAAALNKSMLSKADLLAMMKPMKIEIGKVLSADEIRKLCTAIKGKLEKQHDVTVSPTLMVSVLFAMWSLEVLEELLPSPAEVLKIIFEIGQRSNGKSNVADESRFKKVLKEETWQTVKSVLMGCTVRNKGKS